MAHVIGIIHGEDGAFGISFPDFPGCISSGRTLDEAVSNGTQALAFHIEGMLEDGEAVPDFSPLEVLKATEEDWLRGGVAVAVPVEIPAKSVRINISVDETALACIDRAAEAEGLNRSKFLVTTALARAREIQSAPILATATPRKARKQA
ncbi:type II toxin-antitoxin system HicB family antitoxin [Azorhizobium doebereinerae]|uniref:type II toxin-antitoxin system HicB family antitoxin n=1 Tax=Azorhizobium doebereinerae TaxID=281091 RepID=UPI000A04526B|nr:type II toxin-antitoxin system HicB family antitoxin [Azorhizobium doebereinerae]